MDSVDQKISKSEKKSNSIHRFQALIDLPTTGLKWIQPDENYKFNSKKVKRIYLEVFLKSEEDIDKLIKILELQRGTIKK